MFAFAVAALGTSALVAVASLLWPRVEDRSRVDVPYDPDGPVAQRFKAYGLEGWLVRQTDDGVRAFSAADPRLRCRIEFIDTDDPLYLSRYDRDQDPRGMLFDRCGFSTYTLEGMRTFGPAPHGLDEFTVRDVPNGRAVLDLTRVTVGRCPAGYTWRCSTPAHTRYRGPSVIDEGYTSRFPWPIY